MPTQKILGKLEHIREKGIEVDYPRAPWYTDNKEAILKDLEDTEKRIRTAQHADLLPQLPADRSKGISDGKPRIQRKQIPKIFKFPI